MFGYSRFHTISEFVLHSSTVLSVLALFNITVLWTVIYAKFVKVVLPSQTETLKIHFFRYNKYSFVMQYNHNKSIL